MKVLKQQQGCSGERRLAGAVILRAIKDLEDKKHPTLQKEALRWLQGCSEEDKEYLDLWASIAGINSEAIRKKYQKYRFQGDQLIKPTLQ